MEHRIGRWNHKDLDGWEMGRTKPAVWIKVARGQGSEGRGCLMILTRPGWSQAAATAKNRKYIQEGRAVLLDVFADSREFRGGVLKLGIAIQSAQTIFDESSFQVVEFDRWQTLRFDYDRTKHRKSDWTILNILTLCGNSGHLLIDNVRIEK